MIALARGAVVASRYVLDRPLARGGMGAVWVARHRELETDVAIKFMAPSLVDAAEMRVRFAREARLAALLKSQHVVQILDYGVDDGMPFLVMELLKGQSLAERMNKEGRLSLAFAAKVLTQICKALRTAHEAGLVHRDLKPANIFLAQKDGEDVVKVLDFGIAKLVVGVVDAEALTGTGVALGSVLYMSPEQIRHAKNVDHRSDLWSVGVMMYKALTGRLPFSGTSTGDILVQICTEGFELPSTVVSGLPEPLDRFFEKALMRDPAQRFQSAQEMAEAFLAIVESISTFSRPWETQAIPGTAVALGSDQGTGSAVSARSATGSGVSMPSPTSGAASDSSVGTMKPLIASVRGDISQQVVVVQSSAFSGGLWLAVLALGGLLVGGWLLLWPLFRGEGKAAAAQPTPSATVVPLVPAEAHGAPTASPLGSARSLRIAPLPAVSTIPSASPTASAAPSASAASSLEKHTTPPSAGPSDKGLLDDPH